MKRMSGIREKRPERNDDASAVTSDMATAWASCAALSERKGVRIAEHGQLASESPWHLVEESRISGSDNSADGGLLFGRIASVTVDELGNIYAVDAGVVLKFDPTAR